jgi:hypothetical protein
MGQRHSSEVDKKFPTFTEPEGSLPYSQELATGPYPEQYSILMS